MDQHLLKTLLMYRKQDDSLALAVKYQDKKFEPIQLSFSEEDRPLLKEEEVDYWQRFSIKLSQQLEQRKRQAEKEQKKQSKGRGRRM